MIMKRLFFILAFALGTWGITHAQTAQVSNEYTAAVQKMLEVSNGLDAAQQIMTQLFAVFKSQLSEVPAEAWDRLQKEMSASMLTLEDMKAIIAFYESPAGKKLAASQTGIATESFQVGQKWGEQIGLKVQEQLKKEGYLQ